MADRNDRAYVARKTLIADLQMMAYHLDAIASRECCGAPIWRIVLSAL